MTLTRFSAPKFLLAALAAVSALTLTGCGLGDPAPVISDSMSLPAKVFGTNFGGNTPIVGAKIALYQAGTSGYGVAAAAYSTSGAPHLLTYTTSADNTSNFSFNKLNTAQGSSSGINDGALNSSWACPNDGSDPLIYLLAVGGDPQGGTYSAGLNNPVIVNAAVIGYCSTINSNTRVNLNEISTVGFAVSFAQFAYPGTSTPGNEAISSSAANPLTGTKPQGAIGMYNAFQNLTSNIIDIPNGGVFATPATHAGTATSVSAVVVTATAENAKIISMANILSACINSNNTTTVVASENTYCQQLFDGAQKPYIASATAYGGTFPAPVDTLQAALYMELNPAGLLSTGTGSGTNVVSSGGYCSTAGATTNIGCLYGLVGRATAFSGGLGTQPTDWTVGITYTAGAVNASTAKCTTGNFMYSIYASEVDASGNLWYLDDYVSSNRILAELSPIGQPLLCLKPPLAGNSRGLTIDPTGNVWISPGTASSTNTLYELPASAPTALVLWQNNNTTVTDAVYDTFSDGAGNIFFTTSANGGNLLKFTSPGTNTSQGATVPSIVMSSINNTGTNNLGFGGVDPTGNIWLTSQTNPTQPELQVGGTVISSVSKWTSSATGAGATFTFLTGTIPPVGASLTLSGFTSSSAVSDGLSLNPTITVASSNSTQFTAVMSNPGTAFTSNVTETAAKATDTTAYAVSSVTAGGSAGSFGGAIDNSGYYYSGLNSTSATLQKWTAHSSGAPQTVASTARFLGGITQTRGIVLDGAANVWVTGGLSETGDQTSAINYGVSEIATSGASTFFALSPANTSSPTTCNTTVGCATGGGFYKNDIQVSYSPAIDPSGNLWIPNYNTASSVAPVGTAGTGTSTSIVEIVGAAVPVVTPISVGLANSKLASKP